MLSDCRTPWTACLSGSIARSEQAGDGSRFRYAGADSGQ